MKSLGLIAGSGELPIRILDYCRKNCIELFTIVVKGFGDKTRYDNCIELNFGQVGRAINFFKKHNVTDVVFAGHVKKPSFFKLKIDWKGIKLLKSILSNKILGDNSILETVIKFFESYGINILEVDKVLDNIKFETGFNSNIVCEDYFDDIEIGEKVIEKLSDLDIGQSVIVQQKSVVGIECFEGTEKLINRCSELKYNVGRKPILIKMKKSNQTRKADLPTIGPDTIEQLHNAGFAGIALDSKNCLVVSIEKTKDLANKYNLFIYGI